jgi:hypothetical protein
MRDTILLAAVIAIVVFGFVFLALRARLGSDREQIWPFYAKKVMTSPEQVLFHRLVKALPECIVLAQVQLSRVLGVKKGHNFGQWNNRINRLSIDFLVCLKDSSVVAAIELDDASHRNSAREEPDARKGAALEAAGIKLLRWSVAAIPDVEAIRQAFTSNQPR